MWFKGQRNCFRFISIVSIVLQCATGSTGSQDDEDVAISSTPGPIEQVEEVFPGPLKMVKGRMSNEEHVSNNATSIRDFFRRRRQKAVGESAETSIKLAPNQTASGILMKKIKESKEKEASNFFTESLETSLTSKRKRLVRVRPKFSEFNSTGQNQILVIIAIFNSFKN